MDTNLAGILTGIFAFSLVATATPNSLYQDNEQHTQSLSTMEAKEKGVLADQDNDRLSDGLQARFAGMTKSEFVDVIITFVGAGDSQSNAIAAQHAVGPFKIKREFTLIHGVKATMTVGQAEMLSHIPSVFRVEEDPIVTTQLSGAASDFGAVAARMNYGVNGSGVGICIIDTGIDASHEQFAGRTIHFLDIVNNQVTPYDDHGHGTHVAAIASGGGGTGGNAEIKGVAPVASIYAAKVLDATGSGSGSQIIEGIQYCANQIGVHIISMSLSTASASDGRDAMSLAVNCASDPNYSASCNVTPVNPKIVVVAAGNSGSAPKTVGSPSAAEKAITVGAAANWSENGKGVYLAAFSSRGPTLDGRIKPDITAPGVRISSAKAGDPIGYISYSGTSMATPFTAGSIALMLEKNSMLMNAVIPADAVRNLLISSAQDRGELNSNNSSIRPDNEYGAGLLDVNRGVALAGSSNATPTAFPRYHRYYGEVTSGDQQLFGPFSITKEDIAANVPLAATITINGDLICGYGDPSICNILGGWEWNPDLDMYLLDEKGNIVSGGAGDITRSECALSGEYCSVGRQETIHYLPKLAAAAGNYYLAVASYSGSGSFLLEVSGSASLSSNIPPVAGFIEVCADLNCTFTDISKDEDGTIVSWEWNFGDGFGSTLQHPDYEYSKAGEYWVTLTVKDNQGVSNSNSHKINVTAPSSSEKHIPLANAGGPYVATLSKGKSISVLLDGSGSTDQDGAIISWIWTENGQQIGSGEKTSVNFKEGLHMIRLTVTDNDGLTGWHETTVTIQKGGDSGGGGSGPDCSVNPTHPKCK